MGKNSVKPSMVLYAIAAVAVVAASGCAAAHAWRAAAIGALWMVFASAWGVGLFIIERLKN
jgi:hypothetical protein